MAQAISCKINTLRSECKLEKLIARREKQIRLDFKLRDLWNNNSREEP